MKNFITLARVGWVYCAASLVLATSSLCTADDIRPPANSSFEIIQYNAPAGWQLVERPGPARIYAAPGTNAIQQTFIVILLGQPQANLDLRGALDATIKQMTANGRIIEPGEVSTAKTRQGFDALSQALVSEGQNRQLLFTRMVAANVNNRMAGFCYMATSPELYKLHQGEMDAFLQSVNFAGSAVANGADVAKVKAQIDALEQQKQDLLRKLSEIDAQQKQLAAALPGGAPAEAPGGNPAADEEQLFAKAKERFANEAAGRRKPHTVLGDILLLNGKAIPNLAVCSVYVKGTTVAAERTHFNIEVDQAGHFEQQIPDGIYNIQVTCVVNHDGHHLPVDLMPLDGKAGNLDQSSAAGIVRDYRLIMSGLKPGADPKGIYAYFGGVAVISDVTLGDLAAHHRGGKVRLTFTPQGALIDGSRRPAFAFEADVREVTNSAQMRGIPLGTYHVTATVITPDGRAQPLGCCRTFQGPFTDSAEIFWQGSDVLREDAHVYLKG